MMLKQLLVPLAITLSLYPVLGTATPAARIERYLPGVDQETQNLHTQMLIFNAERKRQEAIATAEEVIERVKASGGNLTTPMLNLSLLQAAAGDFSKGFDTLDQTIAMVKTASGQNSVDLIRPLAAKALLHRLTGQLEQSETALRRAQHILHRSDGVYSTKQRDILDQLTLVELERQEFDDAIREQTYAYQISTLEYGADSLELLPYSYRYAAFLCDMGHFSDSIRVLEDAMQILSEYYGEDDARLIRPLRSIANVGLLQREVARYELALADINPETMWIREALGRPFYITNKKKGKYLGDPVKITTAVNQAHLLDRRQSRLNRPVFGAWQSRAIILDPSTPYTNSVGIVDKNSYRSRKLQPYMKGVIQPLQRVVDILSKDPASDIIDKINALVALGDVHLVSGSWKAFEIYRQVWQQVLDSPNPTELQSRLFGSPFRIQPKTIFPRPLEGKPSDANYAVDTQVSINAEGKISHIRILQSDIPADETRNLKRRLYLFRYRPRMENGEFVATDNLALTMEYYGAQTKSKR